MSRAGAPADLPPATLAAAVLAVAGGALGGAWVRADAASGRAWVETTLDLSAAADALDPAPGARSCASRKTSTPPANGLRPVRRLPPGTTADRVSGGLDLTASLEAGRPVLRRGLLAEAHGGWLVLPGAERLDPAAAAEVCAALDTGGVTTARDGLYATAPARFAAIVLDEGGEAEEAPAPLRERLGLHLALRRPPPPAPEGLAARVAAARRRLAAVRVRDRDWTRLCERALETGEPSLRATGLAGVAARAAAALAGRSRPAAEDLDLAGALVLASRSPARRDERASALPLEDRAIAQELPSPPTGEGLRMEAERVSGGAVAHPRPLPPPGARASEGARLTGGEGAQAVGVMPTAVPAGLLGPPSPPQRASSQGGRGRGAAARTTTARGRGVPAGVRRAGDARQGLALVETLKAAAPWQAIRAGPPGRFQVRPSDFRRRERRPVPRSTVIFVVDASGSAAAERLGEAKGAVERLLADCYARRDRVALVSFRGAGAEVALPPTRAVEHARRRLLDLPAGGATPLAHGLEAAGRLAVQARRGDEAPLLVLVTDGRANVGRSGAPGRAEAARDALAAADALASADLPSLLIDISPRGGREAEALAGALAGRYLHLPHLSAETLAKGVRAARRGLSPERRP